MQIEPFFKYSLLHLTSVMTALTSSWFQAIKRALLKKIKRVAHYCVFQRRSSMVGFQMASFPWEASLKDNLKDNPVSTALNQSDQGYSSGLFFFCSRALHAGKALS
jgi:hypothetical protein